MCSVEISKSSNEILNTSYENINTSYENPINSLENSSKEYAITPTSNEIIKAHNLCKTYKTGNISLDVLKNINLSVCTGEYLSIMGPSGSGKSTFMNIIGCLDTVTHGEYILDGKNIESLSDDDLAVIRNEKIGFVFQAFNLLPRLSILENVELPMLYKGISRENRRKIAMDSLNKVGLSNRLHHKPNEISGGQKQRVAIARSLVNNPSIILADEPTGNLDTKSSLDIMNIFSSLHSEGVTIVMVTHEPEIAQYTKRCVTFRDGEVISDKVR